MEKIFDAEFRETLLNSLKEAGIEGKKASSIVKERYHNALKEAVCNRLKDILSLIEQNKFKEITKFISFSPAGDCMGSNNCYINFSDICDQTDIGDILHALDSNIQCGF